MRNSPPRPTHLDMIRVGSSKRNQGSRNLADSLKLICFAGEEGGQTLLTFRKFCKDCLSNEGSLRKIQRQGRAVSPLNVHRSIPT